MTHNGGCCDSSRTVAYFMIQTTELFFNHFDSSPAFSRNKLSHGSSKKQASMYTKQSHKPTQSQSLFYSRLYHFQALGELVQASPATLVAGRGRPMRYSSPTCSPQIVREWYAHMCQCQRSSMLASSVN